MEYYKKLNEKLKQILNEFPNIDYDSIIMLLDKYISGCANTEH